MSAYEIDVSSLVPEARQAAAETAEAYMRHTEPWFIGILAHGSALKGGHIPGSSDIDLHLYVDDSALDEDHQLPLEVCGAIHRDLTRIDISPFRDIQGFALPSSVDSPAHKWRTGPVPGSYSMIAGKLPTPEATADQVRSNAAADLAGLKVDQFKVASGLLDYREGMLEQRLHLVSMVVWPVLSQVLTLRMEDPLYPWSLPKNEVIRLLPEDEPLGREIREFHRLLSEYYPDATSVDLGLAALERGLGFRRLAKEWYASLQE